MGSSQAITAADNFSCEHRVSMWPLIVRRLGARSSEPNGSGKTAEEINGPYPTDYNLAHTFVIATKLDSNELKVGWMLASAQGGYPEWAYWYP